MTIDPEVILVAPLSKPGPHGVRVDEASWRVVAEHAQFILVPEAQS
jgi:hypothetical protein